MSSAEVFSWGSLGPVPGEDTPAPVGIGRRGLVRHVYAGARGALLAGAQGAEWLPNQSGITHENVGDCGAIPPNLPGVKCAAFGQHHALVLREIGTERDSADDAEGELKTEVLSWGSGGQGEVNAANFRLPCCVKEELRWDISEPSKSRSPLRVCSLPHQCTRSTLKFVCWKRRRRVEQQCVSTTIIRQNYCSTLGLSNNREYLENGQKSEMCEVRPNTM